MAHVYLCSDVFEIGRKTCADGRFLRWNCMTATVHVKMFFTIKVTRLERKFVQLSENVYYVVFVVYHYDVCRPFTRACV